jgi:adenine-specific DNA-methyltransferase
LPESANLKILFEEIFPSDFFVSDIAYERSGSSGLGQGGRIVNTKEHVLAFSSDKSCMNDVQYERAIEFETLKRYNKTLSDEGSRDQVGSFVAPSTGEDVLIYKHKEHSVETISLRNFEERKDAVLMQYRENFDRVFRLTSVQKENEFQNRILEYCNDGLYSADYLVSRGRFAGQKVTLFYFNGQILVWLKDSAKLDGTTIVKGNKITDHWSHGEIPKADLANEGGVTLSRGKKPEQLMKRLVDWCSNEGDTVLDYFSGSGTTPAVCMKTNRKFLAADAERYFDDKSLRRLKNVLYGEKSGISRLTNWSGGGIFKYIRLESYEDTLNNLVLKDDGSRVDVIEENKELRRDYLLNYFLDVETEGSQSLLNIADFRDPDVYKMSIKKPGSDEQAQKNIDLIETFNWLSGLWVEHIAAPQIFDAEFTREKDTDLPEDQNTRLICTRLKQEADGNYWFRLVEGHTLRVPGDKSTQVSTLIIWRKLTDDPEKDNAALQKYLETIGVSTRERTYEVIYVNGSHTLPNPVVEGEQTKVRLIEEAFHQAMWAGA